MDQLYFEEGYKLFLYRRILEVFFPHSTSDVFVWHLVTHAILSFSYANRNSYYLWNAMTLTLFHASTIFSLLHKFCIRVTFLLISAKSLKRVNGKAHSGAMSKKRTAQMSQSRQYLGPTSDFCLSVLVPLYHLHGFGGSKVIHRFLTAWGGSAPLTLTLFNMVHMVNSIYWTSSSKLLCPGAPV